MSHTVTVVMSADQEISINGLPVNIHDIESIRVDGDGQIAGYQLKTKVMANELFDALVSLLGDDNADHVSTSGFFDLLTTGDDINHAVDVVQKWKPFRL